jgi:hypothetical protein
VCSKVIQAYAAHLASQRDLLELVPAFLCHLRLTERRNLARIMMSTALDQFIDDSNVSNRGGTQVQMLTPHSGVRADVCAGKEQRAASAAATP